MESRSIDVKVYRPRTQSVAQDIPDSFFEPTTHQLAVAFQGQSKARQNLTEAPLLTKRLRDEKAQATQIARRQKYPNTKIRVKFADQTQIETAFSSFVTIQAVYDFILSALKEDIEPIPFFLYQTPPRKEFKQTDPKVKGVSLLDLNLAPSSMLYIKFEREDLNNRTTTAPLLDELLATQQELPPPPTFDNPSALPTAEAHAPQLAEGKAKVPKWLNKAIGKK